ncbi:hypothetical protein RRG08_062394 [Elysia crispata]|uniref:Uncharacterized protein n=1 Tax=Elysia crispata TaxID=231223 RepID=A0AAE0XQM2_9GAST|nr:hypothetical protein RRG08_062394 [Elysia crispata]
MVGVRWKVNWLVLVGLVVSGVFFYFVTSPLITKCENNSKWKPEVLAGDRNVGHHSYLVWPAFSTESFLKSTFFKQKCAPAINFTMSNLVLVKKQWSTAEDFRCRRLLEKFLSIFTFEARDAPLKLPTKFKDKVKHWLGDNDELLQQVYNQEVIHVVSEYTREHTIFNSLRDKRPVLPPAESEDDYFKSLLAETAKNCDFCNYKENTAEHVFGRLESKHSFTASNAFKLDTLHALVAPKKHDPLHWSLEEFLDLFGLVGDWLKKAHTYYPDARFPSLIWDVLPKCGASQVHPHLHVMLDPKRYHGQVEAWREGASDYYRDHGSNYFTDMLSIYSALNLTLNHGAAVAFPNLVPKRDHEMIVISKDANEDFYTLLFLVLRAFIDSFKVKCFSMGMGLPAIDVEEGRIPAYARIITRGYVTDIRTDMSSLELFMAASVNIDPYRTIHTIKQFIAETRLHL